MTNDDLKALQKEVRKKKRIATERASEVHDLVEDRLWTDYEALLELSQLTVAACSEWAEANKTLAALESDLA
jgi:hypothetical protein